MDALRGRAVIVTGAAAGLGRAYALDAAREGAAVVVNDIDAEGVEQVVAEIAALPDGGRAVAAPGSVADWDTACAVVDLCLEASGRVDGLVNNAGVLSLRQPEDEDEISIRRTVEVNLVGALFMGTHTIRAMIDQGSGSIVNCTSSAQLGLSTLGVYGATKGALASLTYSWAVDLSASGIRVNAYSPVAGTAMAAMSPVVPPDLPTPEENAAAVTYLLSDRSDGITGQVVQRRGDRLIVVSHPSFTDHVASAEEWTLAAITESFDPVLREHLQPVGFSIVSAAERDSGPAR